MALKAITKRRLTYLLGWGRAGAVDTIWTNGSGTVNQNTARILRNALGAPDAADQLVTALNNNADMSATSEYVRSPLAHALGSQTSQREIDSGL